MSENLDKRKYLKPEIVTSLSSLALRARLIVEGYIIGKHRSPYHGFSVEFAEHKSYDIGDDVRNIDWNVTARGGAPFVKVFEEERELNLSFSLSYLHNICAYSKLAKTVELCMSENYPIRLVYSLGEDDAKFVFYLAPKIDD